MKYGQKVRVTSGFYEGMEGIVIAESIANRSGEIRYVISDYFGPLRYLNSDLQLDLQTFEKSDLELIK